MSTDRSPAPSPSPKKAPAKRGRSFVAWLEQRHDPLTSLLLTIPVFLVYHLGILVMPMRNGVDLVSGATFALLSESRLGYIGLTLGYCVAIGAAVALLRKKGTIHRAEFLPMLGESAVLAVLMSFTVGWATARLVDWQIDLQAGVSAMGPLEKLVMAAGAGFHEELIFRVVLFAGGAFLLGKLTKLSETKAVLIAALVSSFVFSAIHYVGPFGDPFFEDLSVGIPSFVFRFLAGLFLATVYRFRGFAVAVYTHAIYDLIVFFLR